MSTRSIGLSDKLHVYLINETLKETGLLRRLREETAALPDANMQISPEQGQFMRLLVELLGGRRAIEIGTFTGYSALCVAAALPDDGRLIACDTNETWTAMARVFWREAGVDHKIELRLAPALETLEQLLADGAAESFDFAFIDADKPNYDRYYESCLRLLRGGGLIAVDNALWSGKVADAAVDDEDTRSIRALNVKVREDERVTSSLVPIGDGLLLARKRYS